MDSTDTNAVAGPSTIPLASSSRPASPIRLSVTPHLNPDRISLFLPPPGQQLPPAYIQSTQDLLGQFHLREAYDKYVRPFLNSSEDPAPNDRNGTITTPSTMTGQNGLPGALDKGKGKEVVHASTPAADGQDVDDDDGPGGKGEKKKKNSYKNLINGVPGKHSFKKDDYLTTLMQAPPKQRVRISEFDSRTQRDAFTVSLEGLKGWNPSALVLLTAQAREDRKKRKELKKLAKAQMLVQSQAPTQQSSPAASTPIPAPLPTPVPLAAVSATARISAPSSTPRPSGPGTPRPHTAPVVAPPAVRPGSTKPVPQPVQIPGAGVRVSTPLRTATPTGPHPLSAPPLSASSIAPPGGTAAAPQQHVSAASALPRGKKRERERDDPQPPSSINGNVAAPVNLNGTNANVGGIPNIPQAIIGARAGNNGVRPRMIKKQKMDSTAPVQQHTPV